MLRLGLETEVEEILVRFSSYESLENVIEDVQFTGWQRGCRTGNIENLGWGGGLKLPALRITFRSSPCSSH